MNLKSLEQFRAKYAVHSFNGVPTISGLNQIVYSLEVDDLVVTKESFAVLLELINGYKTISLWPKTNWLEHKLSKSCNIVSVDSPDTKMPKVYGEIEYLDTDKMRPHFEAAELILIKNGCSEAIHKIQPYLLNSHRLLVWTDLQGIVKEDWKTLHEVDELNKIQLRFTNQQKHKWTYCQVRSKPKL